MALLQSIFLLLVLLACLSNNPSQAISDDTSQSHFFQLMKASLSGDVISDWDIAGGKPYCNLSGISCNDQGYVNMIDISERSLTGQFPSGVCSYLPGLRVLRLSRNHIRGNFLNSLVNCSLLEELNLSSIYLTGKLPDFSRMQKMRMLDLSYNLFTGEFPLSVFNLTNLEELNFNENPGFNLWQLPESISRMKNLREMILCTCMLQGQIPASIGNMTSLIDLELTGNFITGHIPPEIGLLKNLQQLELYYNQQLSGTIPEELGNLTWLTDLDMSVNHLTGKIPESLLRLPKLRVLQLYNNSLTGEIPSVIANSTTLTILSLYDNFLTGEVPKNLGQSSPLVVLDLSENRLSGPLPTQICNGGKLKYFLVLENMFFGGLSDSLAKCTNILRFRVSNNHLEGSIPEGIFELPHVSIIDLSDNNFSGSIAKTIRKAGNLSELFMQRNKISGVIPSEISRAFSLVKIDLSDNLLSGPIPSGIGNLKKLNLLLLQGNKLNSSIPNSLSSLKSLNVLDLSNNLLTGNIPENLCELLPTSINFSNNRLSGPIPLSLIKGGLVESFSGNPGLCVSVYVHSPDQNFPLCNQTKKQRRLNYIWAVVLSPVIALIGLLLFLKRCVFRQRAVMEHDETLSSFFSFEVKSFHRISFDQREILDAVNEKNKIGQGGSGTVYKIELSSGEIVAVKKLRRQRTKESASEDRLQLDKGLKAEVETLGNIRHKNIVKLYCYFASLDCNLLVYEYMPNGNLWDALHKGLTHLDWPIRHNIAFEVAQGLAYLHHGLLSPIIHRDIKSTNILLDVNYHPKVADFGIAKVLQARGGKDSTTTVIAGTYGYLAPEYAYSSKATTKCDVYSYGVVLMELITGRKPVEAEFGENKNIICWVSSKIDTKEGVMEVLDKKLSGSFRDEMIQVLRIAICCTSKTPAMRPTMNEVVQLLTEADPCRFNSCKFSNKSNESSIATKIKNPSEL